MEDANSRVSRSTAKRLLAGGCGLLLLGVYLLSMSRVRLYLDGEERYALTRSLVEHGSICIEKPGSQGRVPTKYGLGQPLAMVPLYLVGKVFCGNDNTAAGPEVPAVFAVNLFNQLVTALTGAVLALFLTDLGYATGVTALTVLTYGLATAAWPNARWLGNEPLNGLLLLTMVMNCRRCLRQEQDSRSGYWAALAGAGATLSNEVLAPLVLLLTTGCMVWSHRRARLAARTFVGWWLILGLGLVTALGYNWLRYRTPLMTGYEGDHGFRAWPYSGSPGFSTPLLVGLYGNLFSVGRSVFLFSPPLLLALMAGRGFWRKHSLAAGLTATVAGYLLLVYSKWWCWYGGACWGNRVLLPLVPVSMCFVAEAWAWADRGWRRAMVGTVVLTGLLVQVLAVSVFHMRFFAGVVDMAKGYQNEYLIHFVPQASPLAGQVALLRALPPRDWDFALIGLLSSAPGAALVLLGTGCGAVIGGVFCLWRVCRQPGPSQSPCAAV